MKKYILLALALILIAGCQDPNFVYSVKYCKSEVKSITPNSVSFYEEAGKIKFTQILNTYCSFDNKIRLNYERNRKYIEIEETLYVKEATKCICPMEVRGEFKEALEPGIYNVKFTLDNSYTNQITIVHESDLEIK